MPSTLTASDRPALIRLASNLPAGSTERRAILAVLSSHVAGTYLPTYPKFEASLRDGRLSMRSDPPGAGIDRAFAETFKAEAVRQFNAVVLPRLVAGGYKLAGPPRLNVTSNEVTFPVRNDDTDTLVADINNELARV